MPELLRLQTPEFEFSVWCSDISTREQVHQTTLARRTQASSPQTDELIDHTSVVRFSPALAITPLAVGEQPVNELELPTTPMRMPELMRELVLDSPLFFENTQYQFEWVFFDSVRDARLTHRSQAVNDGFRFAAQRGPLPARLTGTINTGNDVGWMRLPLEYERADKTVCCNLALEVLPTKMDLRQDLPVMYQAIDQTFPLWRFSLVAKTEQDAAKGMQRGDFPLMWLANFGALRERFEQGLKVISQAPHSRLQPHVVYNKAARLKGGIAYKLGTKVKEDLANGRVDKRYKVEKKKLSVDTPENRFIKMVVSHSKKQLTDFEQRLRHSNQAPDRQRLSDAFLNELHSWQQPLQKVLGQSFLKEVGKFSGISRESLVLQQKIGYSAVYRVWQELKFYLDAFANQSSISIKSVAEIYEVWCFLTLRNILVDELGFVEVPLKRGGVELNKFFEYQLKDGLAGAFKFERADGVKLRLAHEPPFFKKGQNMRTYLLTQKPDIVLEVTFPEPSNKSFLWLFDAKYRIKSDKNRFDESPVATEDLVPDDAINQMHRYRDALIRTTQETQSSAQHKSRPVCGAFALYPGYFDQQREVNPYLDAINEIGIGAFALLPDSSEVGGVNKTGRFWLMEFLREQIGGDPRQDRYSAHNLEERLYVQESARIPYYGMKQVLYPDLTMTIALGGQGGRSKAYFSAFELGIAKWYHLPKKTFTSEYKQHIVDEIRYLALAATSEKNSNYKQIDKLWPVKKVVLVPRNVIAEEQAGKLSNSEELYYLFELGEPLVLKDAVSGVPHRPINKTIKLTTLTWLESTQQFSELKTVYLDALV